MFFLSAYYFCYIDMMKSNVLLLSNEISRHSDYQYSEAGCFLAFIVSSREKRLKPGTLLKVTLLRGCFSRFLNCADGTKSQKASQIL